ncbi:endoribonuclease MazF [Salinisphaera sp. P385]|uniref:Endoribonuclease MazF n=1 Tax=Spectribacter acetivorans TaxID=3075603 RepID=A0ABU3B9C3_9GAMM|nr:endoribonuclease MazF [Salinisphaera sp. P385]MDT0617581.1 endoribonuclease MazF [Salinisphaera sp. P385]
MSARVPDVGDVVWLRFNPQAGTEQAGHRSALCLSPADYNRASGLMVCCPMTSRIKGYPFEVRLSGNGGGVVLADQLKSLDWRARRARPKGRITDHELAEVQAKVRTLILPE